MPKQEYILGSADTSEIVIPGRDVLPRHARLTVTGKGPRVEAIEGASLVVNGQSISHPVYLHDGDWLALGTTLFQIVIQPVGPEVSTGGVPAGAQSRILTIGRLPECDLHIPSPLVSREHARMLWEAGHWVLEDLGSTNGTFVNGERLAGRVTLYPRDRIEIATFAFIFTGHTLEPVDITGRVCIEVHDLVKEVRDRASGKPKRLLDQISLVIEPGEFVGIFGTSGSGKSTLLDALSGRRSPSGGKVLYNGTDLYESFDLFRAAIGYVPQQDIVHRKIAVARALGYNIARLRLPADTSAREIDAHISRVLERVGLAEKAALPIDTPEPLSGGQLKRVSLAVELVANPTTLFLDEVTSGLDAGTDKRMMRLFADLAADQKTVICVTHTLENIDACHLVALLHQGRLVYFGPPAEAPGYFGVARLTEVYELLEDSKPGEWAEKFLNSIFYKRYITDRLSAPPQEAYGQSRTKAGSRQAWFDRDQFNTLVRRYWDVILSDRLNLAILLLQAPAIAAVIGLVFNSEGPLPARAAAQSQIAFMLVLSAIWFGCLNAARELVKELPIYLRERSVNLGLGPYLASKLVPLAVLCAIQCLMLLAIVSVVVELPGSFIERAWTLFLAGMAATTLGLTVSASVDSNDKAIAMVPILLIPQVVLSNAIVALDGIGEGLAKATMISFWSFDAMKTTLESQILKAQDAAGALIVPLAGAYWSDLGMVIVLGLAFLASTVFGLKLKDRRR